MSASVSTSTGRLVLDLPDEAASQRLGQRLAATLPARAVVHLRGDLGAGKTTLARALLRALGVEGAIKSPTYTLIERYPVEGGEVAHLDLYRIADPEELSFLGLDELADSARLWLVEWPDRGAAFLPAADLRIGLAVEGAGRRAELEPLSPQGARWLTALAALK
ncbi:tRNA (adenosine(37)-N6)-threonylcarbamoyltransferase complex ATPase subunit type 1 TsaE [Aquimonas voraii]|uniref:tRNA threonylcarbamoyladenosine biosynthesis protein TsaE n=1 Tax=Aquimonas voraii TaxID=265719 RepID=A0A1G6SIH7_9GAMM|nr:tRNA (adenosine(37)-N6)-threonylcarbamoyltransferase complex ATPase subunit type 1 TsaE [Aquimonas voraii]SDD16702.1 tRNA threonylcarbamoyladenosine biosynthesis protein TsaE [Aquimonas voraii]